MADAHVALQPEHVPRMKYITHQAERLAHEKPAFVTGNDAGGILPTVLQQRQPVVKSLIYRPLANDSDDPAHLRILKYRVPQTMA